MPFGLTGFTKYDTGPASDARHCPLTRRSGEATQWRLLAVLRPSLSHIRTLAEQSSQRTEHQAGSAPVCVPSRPCLTFNRLRAG
jgi:hypothetical protein